jgi:hypothetical protein
MAAPSITSKMILIVFSAKFFQDIFEKYLTAMFCVECGAELLSTIQF